MFTGSVTSAVFPDTTHSLFFVGECLCLSLASLLLLAFRAHSHFVPKWICWMWLLYFHSRGRKKTSMRVKFQTICWAAVGRKFPQSDWCQILSSLIFLSRIVFQLGWWMWAHRLIWRWWWWWSKSVLYRSRQQSCRRLNSSSVLLFVRK